MNVHWPSPDDAETWFAINLACKATLLLLLAAGLSLLAWRSSAALRHRLWALSFVGLLFLPAASSLLPGFSWPVVPHQRQATSPVIAEVSAVAPAVRKMTDRTPASLAAPRSSAAETKGDPGPDRVNESSAIKLESAFDRRIVESADLTAAAAADASSQATVIGPLTHRLVWVWLAGAVLTLVPLAVGLVANTRVRFGNRRLHDSDWRPLVSRLSNQLGLRRPVTLLSAGPRQMPLTFGLWRPCVVLPADAQTWTTERRQIVLLHELGHIQRYDVPLQMIARLACAVYWFHPLAWWALRQMRVEREHACDDAVLRAGQKASGYAAELLEIARAHSGSSPLLNAALSMARPSQLEGRLLAVLDANRSRAPVGPRWTGGLLTLTAAVICGLGAVRPTATAKGPAVALEKNTERSAASIGAPPSIGRHDQQMLIAGIVLSPSGKPAVGAIVEIIAHGDGGGWTRITPGIPSFDHYQTKSDDTGHFRLNVPHHVSRPLPFMSVLASDQDHHLAMEYVGPGGVPSKGL